jgi:curved DNA-binding protein CbpA
MHEGFCERLGYLSLACSATPQMLIDAGAILDHRGAGGRTPLHAAAAAGDNELVQLLVQQEGVDKDAVDDQHRTALHLAARTKRVAVVQTLLQLGADAEVASADGKTARDLALDPMIGTGDLDALERVFDGPETRFWNHSARAVALHRAGELGAAFEQYGLALGLASGLGRKLSADDRARLHLNRARVAQRLELNTQALEDCEAALTLDSATSYRKALAIRAESAFTLFDFERAAADLKPLLDADPNGDHAERWGELLQEAKILAKMTFYEVLSLDSEATASEIKKAFRRESIKWHPDKHTGNPDANYRATLKFKLLNESNQTLGDAAKRVAYDRKLRYAAWEDDDDTDILGRFRRGSDGKTKDEAKENVLAKHRLREAELSNMSGKEKKAQAVKEEAREAADTAAKEAALLAAKKKEAIEQLRREKLEGEMRRLDELSALQKEREAEIQKQRDLAHTLSEQLRELKEQQRWAAEADPDDLQSDGELDSGEDGDADDLDADLDADELFGEDAEGNLDAYRAAYERYLHRRKERMASGGTGESEDEDFPDPEFDPYGDDDSSVGDDGPRSPLSDPLSESPPPPRRAAAGGGGGGSGASYRPYDHIPESESDDERDYGERTPSEDRDSDLGDMMAEAEAAMNAAEDAIRMAEVAERDFRAQVRKMPS